MHQYTLTKILPNNGRLLNGILISKLLNNSLASCSLRNDILLPHITDFDSSIVLPLLVSKTLG